jgi:hypothetical protein
MRSQRVRPGPALVMGPQRWVSPELARHQAEGGLEVVRVTEALAGVDRGDEGGGGHGSDAGDGAEALDALIVSGHALDRRVGIHELAVEVAYDSEEQSGSKYLWLYAEENLPEQHRERFAQLKAITLKTARAWAIKESLRELWHYTRVGWAERHWKWWYFWATHSRLTPVIETARLIRRHLPNVLTFFAHRITQRRQ